MDIWFVVFFCFKQNTAYERRISDWSSDVCSSDLMAWFFFTAPVGAIIVQNLCLATSVYLDTRADPVFPRWVAHFNIAIAALMIPSAFSLLCKTGPLAWDGSLSFTLRLGTDRKSTRLNSSH